MAETCERCGGLHRECPWNEEQASSLRSGWENFGLAPDEHEQVCSEDVEEIAQEMKSLRADIERLRKALEEIERMCATGYYGDDKHGYAIEAKAIARHALEGK